MPLFINRLAGTFRRLSTALPVVLLCAAGGLAGCAVPPPGIDVPAPAPTTPDRTLRLDVNFDFDSHRIRPDSYANLDTFASAAADPQLAGLHYNVDGHTDIVGRFGYNVALSFLRANAVIEYLVARGMRREMLHAQGFGPTRPLDPVHPASGVNRRVEITSIR